MLSTIKEVYYIVHRTILLLILYRANIIELKLEGNKPP